MQQTTAIQLQNMRVYIIEAKSNLKRMIMRGLVQKLRSEHPL
jgi:hypothetical protein